MKHLNNEIKYVGHDELHILENLINYNKSIVFKFKKYVNNNYKVLDFGAGIGTLIELFKSTYNIIPTSLEIDPTQAKIIRSKNFECHENIDQLNDNYFDLIYSSNVFEHIENDNLELIKLIDKLKINGYVCLYLPANEYLWSELDNKVLHFRRYDKEKINYLIKNTTLKVVEFKYCDPIGAIFTFVFKLLNLKLNNLNNKNLKLFDNYFFPLNKLIETITFNKFGKNIFVTLKKY